MTTQSVFDEWLPDVTVDPIVTNDDVNVEARQNMWSFSLTSDQLGAVTTDDVVQFINSIVTSRLEQIRRRHLPPMVLYFWHDQMANQLRVSMVSARTGVSLPFNCSVNSFVSIADIASRYLALADSNHILWEGLLPEHTCDTFAADADATRDVLDVYATVLCPVLGRRPFTTRPPTPDNRSE